MGICINHPDRETSYLCQKHQVYLCEECLACSDPQLYCKFRSSCIIWFITRKYQVDDQSATSLENIKNNQNNGTMEASYEQK